MAVAAQTLTQPSLKPMDTRLVALAEPFSAASEQYRLLCQKLDRMALTRTLKVVAVTSSARGEGRSTTAANLAVTAAQDGREVLLVECDLRKPSLGHMLDLAPRAGLADVLTGGAEIGQALCRVGNLSVLCAGEVRDSGSALKSSRVKALLDGLRADYDLIVLDAPPALAMADANRLALQADGVLLVVRADSTPRAVVKLAVEALHGNVLGIVLNGVDPSGSRHARYLYGAEA